MIDRKRRLALLALGGTALAGAGCTTKPLRPVNADGTYCYRIGKSYRPTLTCTPAPIPPEAVEVEAKRFEPASNRLTVYLVRKRWGDAKNLVRVSSESGSTLDTVPNTFARLRLSPGSHRLTATWPEGTTSLDIGGNAGEVIFVELIGSVWAWGSSYRLERGEPAESRDRAARLRLVADVG